MKPKRYVPVITGVVSISMSILLAVGVQSWWAYLVAGFLMMYGWFSLKTAMLATDREIVELTENVPMSNETKRRLDDRYQSPANHRTGLARLSIGAGVLATIGFFALGHIVFGVVSIVSVAGDAISGRVVRSFFDDVLAEGADREFALKSVPRRTANLLRGFSIVSVVLLGVSTLLMFI